MTDPRLERLAENERFLRDANRRIEALTRDLSAQGFARRREEAEFLCACGRADCRERITLTIAEYEAVHVEPHMFVVAPGHETPEIEDVVARHDRYLVVRKKPEYRRPDGG